MSAEERQFDFLSAVTAVVVAVFLGGATYALVAGAINFDKFLAVVGPPASMLLGYWVRGKQ